MPIQATSNRITHQLLKNYFINTAKLLSYCESFLFNDYQEIRIESFEKNIKTKAFYLENGWNESDIEPDVVTGGNKYILTKQRGN